MASTFWYLENGRCFAHRWSVMFYILRLINDEIRVMEGGQTFSAYLDYYIWNEEKDEYNGFGGFYRTATDEMIMPEIDLREFTPANTKLFWKGAQNAFAKLIANNNKTKEDIIHYLKILLDMYKDIKKGEKPNKDEYIKPYSGEKKGPGWE